MQSAGDRLLPLGACPQDLGCNHRWNDGDEGAYGSHPMTFQMGLYTCETNSLQKYSSLFGDVRECRWKEGVPRARVRRLERGATVDSKVENCCVPKVVVDVGAQLHGALNKVVDFLEEGLWVRRRILHETVLPYGFFQFAIKEARVQYIGRRSSSLQAAVESDTSFAHPGQLNSRRPNTVVSWARNIANRPSDPGELSWSLTGVVRFLLAARIDNRAGRERDVPGWCTRNSGDEA
ncbi:hypothetical protein EJ07DRAFT_153517 [Lizonia empirigonia]|nr:hypothetical protein EJ07DRAFT_153517 [Lizonia empirigonia]